MLDQLNNLGVTFAPTADQARLAPYRGAQEGVQPALQVLSLRMPQGPLGRGAIAPRSLLEPQAAGYGGMDAAVLQSILKAILTQRGGAGLSAAGSAVAGAPGMTQAQAVPAGLPSEPPPIFRPGSTAPADWRVPSFGMTATAPAESPNPEDESPLSRFGLGSLLY